jgi:hypothetical protein
MDTPRTVIFSAGAQLRLDAIDALETHYTPVHGTGARQPLELAHAAAQELLDWLGFTGVNRDANETVDASDQDQVPGYLLTRGADVYGRCVALVGCGAAPAASGSQVFVDTDLLRTTYCGLSSRSASIPAAPRTGEDLRDYVQRWVGSAVGVVKR